MLLSVWCYWQRFGILWKNLEFYEKISPVFSSPSPSDIPLNWGGTKGGVLLLWNGKVKYLIPSPTLCPDCRQQRRLSWRNERKLYKRKCDATGEDIISIYSPDKSYIVYDQDFWWSDKWEALYYGRDFDFSKSFFEQFSELMNVVPKCSVIIQNCVNSNYTNYSADNNNCYLCISSHRCENLLFSYRCHDTKDSLDCVNVNHSHLCYELIDSENCYKVFHSQLCNNCSNSLFLKNCEGCSDCLFCTTLRNKQFHILNKQYSKEEYLKIYKLIIWNKDLLEEYLKKLKNLVWKTPNRELNNLECENCYGDYLYNSKNLQDSYYVQNSKDSSNIYDGSNVKYSKDTSNPDDMELCYENSSSINNYNVLFSYTIWWSKNLYYCYFTMNSENCFGCISLKNKQYCILNKQYTKEEYEKLVPKIIENMSSPQTSPEGERVIEWWEFFPSSISPFWYNETVANEYFPLSREKMFCHHEFISGSLKGKLPNYDSETSSEWQEKEKFLKWEIFNWSDYEAPFSKVEKIIPASKLPENISEVPDDILNWAIECEITKKPFRITTQELSFYRKQNLPIPRLHPDQRHLERMKKRNPRKLFTRKCNKCGKEIQTTYDSERPEIVYCENCYNKEVY